MRKAVRAENSARGKILVLMWVLMLLMFAPATVCCAKAKTYSFGLRVNRIWLQKGQQRTLKVYSSDSRVVTKKLRFKSSNRKVASVNARGVVTGKDTGIARITAVFGSKPKKISLNVSVVDVKLVAHRGLGTEAPANSKAAFELAGEAGFWGVEADIRETGKDENGETGFVLVHAVTTLGAAGVNKRVKYQTYDEVRALRVTGGVNASKYKQTICTLEEYLDICNKYNMVPFIDIKDSVYSYGGVKKMIRILHEKKLLNKVRFVSSKLRCFSRLIEYSEKKYHIRPKIQMNTKTGNYKGTPLMDQLDLGVKNGYYGYSLYFGDLKAAQYRLIKKNGMALNLWTMRSGNKEKMLRLIRKYRIESVMVEGVF